MKCHTKKKKKNHKSIFLSPPMYKSPFPILWGSIPLTQPIMATSTCFSCDKTWTINIKNDQWKPTSAPVGQLSPIIKTPSCCEEAVMNEPDIDVARAKQMTFGAQPSWGVCSQRQSWTEKPNIVKWNGLWRSHYVQQRSNGSWED